MLGNDHLCLTCCLMITCHCRQLAHLKYFHTGVAENRGRTRRHRHQQGPNKDQRARHWLAQPQAGSLKEVLQKLALASSGTALQRVTLRDTCTFVISEACQNMHITIHGALNCASNMLMASCTRGHGVPCVVSTWLHMWYDMISSGKACLVGHFIYHGACKIFVTAKLHTI